MSTIHEFKCDTCKKRVKASYNGEHYLPPQDWVCFYDDNIARVLDVHLCGQCKPSSLKVNKKAKK